MRNVSRNCVVGVLDPCNCSKFQGDVFSEMMNVSRNCGVGVLDPCNSGKFQEDVISKMTVPRNFKSTCSILAAVSTLQRPSQPPGD